MPIIDWRNDGFDALFDDFESSFLSTKETSKPQSSTKRKQRSLETNSGDISTNIATSSALCSSKVSENANKEKRKPSLLVHLDTEYYQRNETEIVKTKEIINSSFIDIDSVEMPPESSSEISLSDLTVSSETNSKTDSTNDGMLAGAPPTETKKRRALNKTIRQPTLQNFFK